MRKNTGDKLFDYLDSTLSYLYEIVNVDVEDNEIKNCIVDTQDTLELIYNQSFFDPITKDIRNWLLTGSIHCASYNISLGISDIISLIPSAVDAAKEVIPIIIGEDEYNRDILDNLVYKFIESYKNGLIPGIGSDYAGNISIENRAIFGMCTTIFNFINTIVLDNHLLLNNHSGRNTFCLSDIFEKDNPILIITHNDNDGFFCAGVLWSFMKNRDIKNLRVHTTGYRIDFDKIKELLKDVDEVWVTDLNLSIDTLDELVSLKRSARWYYVDHHTRNFKNTKDEYKFLSELNTLFYGYSYRATEPSSEYNESACLLLYRSIISTTVDVDPLYTNMLEYVSAWDTRCFAELDKDTVFNVTYGMKLTNFDPSYYTGLHAMYDLLKFDNDEYIDYTICKFKDTGKTLLKYKNIQNEMWTKICGFEFTIVDDSGREYSGFAYNYIGDSYCFPDNIMDKYDICATFYIMYADKFGVPRFKVTLYSNKSTVRCGSICNQIDSKGGGHPGAGGFMYSGFPFTSETQPDGSSKLFIRTLKQRSEVDTCEVGEPAKNDGGLQTGVDKKGDE